MTIINNFTNNFFCSFIEISTGHYKCSKCGNVVVSQDSYEIPVFPCSYSHGTKLEDVKQNINNLFNDNICDEQTLSNRHYICQKCEYFQNSTCSKCGCNITKNLEYMNKLAHSDESCPIGKW
jgi:hypothetical protein